MNGVYQAIPSPFGEVLVAEVNSELCAVSFTNDERSVLNELAKWYPSVNFVYGKVLNGNNVLALMSGEVVEDIPISHLVFERCSDFRKSVYKELLRIPRGTTKTYSEIASQMKRPRAYRAVAQACSANIVAVVIPCHRVVASNGSLGGYTWGVEMKRELLNIESLSCLEFDPNGNESEDHSEVERLGQPTRIVGFEDGLAHTPKLPRWIAGKVAKDISKFKNEVSKSVASIEIIASSFSCSRMKQTQCETDFYFRY
ncbi:hypothetical protein KIN20_009339 [Parelaphostrongylus tenuis]|uniref:Methylated-DNA--protein-cysteine methyltransferase n=1 Tax=Parelaphostrongylus tenuis TaxID=148309 RepID=A0AAD5QNA9_PARTN|nr:hypothetical protein KIN20_009339 [Parelaphostrongylus tenuis]